MQPPILFTPASLHTPVFSDEARQSESLKSLLECWRQIFPDSQESPSIDFEDWAENAVRLCTAVKLYPDRTAIYDPETDLARYLNGEPVAAEDGVHYLGTWLRQHEGVQGLNIGRYGAPLNVTNENVSGIRRYPHSEVFRQYAKREIMFCGSGWEEGDAPMVDLLDQLIERAKRGDERVFIKACSEKYLVQTIELSHVPPTRAAMENAIHEQSEGLGWAMVHLAGRPNAFIVQEHVPMHCEYRVVVIDHKPVSGAGCVECLTPLANQDLWDSKMEEVRSTGFSTYPEMLEKYQALANEFCAKFAEAHPDCKSYTLDLASNDQGDAFVIELNPPLNYGLYAMDYAAILRAEVAMTDKLSLKDRRPKL